MGVKRKGKVKRKGIKLEGGVGLCYDGGIYALADKTGLGVDEMFLVLIKLCLHGLLMPIEKVLPNNRLQLNFGVAKSWREMKQMRREMIRATRVEEDEFGEWKKLRDELFGKPPERPDKKG